MEVAQRDRADQIRGIQSLPFYIASCDVFASLVWPRRIDEYLNRAWCQVRVCGGPPCLCPGRVR